MQVEEVMWTIFLAILEVDACKGGEITSTDGLGRSCRRWTIFWVIDEVDECWLTQSYTGEPLHPLPQHMAGVTTGHPGNVSGMSLHYIVY